MSDRPETGEWPASLAGPSDRPHIAGYEILAQLGRGGMGVVYRARQLTSQRLVALKLLRDGALASPQQLARFRIEAEAVARMQHPNIVQVYEVGITEPSHAGWPYYAMELVEGGSLAKHLAGQPLSVQKAAELIRTLALAVQHAHDQKIIHRDLKPSNILLQAQAQGLQSLSLAQPKIADFGLAKRLDSDSTAWTQDGAVLGTASYMAPEQAAGRIRDLGPAVDIYALGAILYETLTGRPPFHGDSWNHTLQQVLHDEPESLRGLRPDVPVDLETICLKCLEKEPARRYGSAQELADDLSRFLQGTSILAVPLDERQRLARLAARDGYQIVAEIGRGPRSVVYQARYEPLKQPVALKVFRQGLCTKEEWEARLRHGADLWAALTHPHIIPVHRTGWWDGCPYVALEFLPQGSLAAKLVDGPFPLRQALRLMEQLAETVGYIHRQGVVHGNLKPSNVLLAADGIPRIMDFRLTGGLFLGPMPTEDPTGIEYLAPEFITEPEKDLHPYTDIYGLGLVLYELLTGRAPFVGSTVREALAKVTSEDALPPSTLNRNVTSKLDAWCLHCLRKNPWKRYTRAYDLQMRLHHYLEDPEGRRRPGPGWKRTAREDLD